MSLLESILLLKKKPAKIPIEVVIKIDQRYFRPSEVDSLLGDSTKAKKKLGWQNSTSLEQLISEMIKSDRKIASKKSLLIKHGYTINKKNND